MSANKGGRYTRATADIMFIWVMDEPVIPETKASLEVL
jgi:hypothetical protein